VFGCACNFSCASVWVCVKWILPCGKKDVFRCVAGAFFFEVGLEDIEDLVGFCSDFICDRVSDGG